MNLDIAKIITALTCYKVLLRRIITIISQNIDLHLVKGAPFINTSSAGGRSFQGPGQRRSWDGKNVHSGV